MRRIIIPDIVIASSNVNIPRYFVAPEENDLALYTSYMGTSYFSFVELSIPQNNNPNALDNNPNNPSTSIRFTTCLITISQAKNIVKTLIQGRNGSIKEYISLGDYLINIKGMIISSDISAPMKFPEEEVNIFKEIMEYSSDVNDNNLDIISPFVNKFVSRVVVDDFELKEVTGSRNTLEFSIDLISDDNPLIYDTTTT